MAVKYNQFDSSYAQSCLTAAQVYYQTGKINQSATADYNNFAYSFMNLSETNDNMGMAAAMLYKATGTTTYLLEAENYASSLSAWVNLTYHSLDPMLFIELYVITGNTTYLNNVESLVNGFTNESCGYYHSSNWGSIRDAGCAAFIAALYHQQTNDVEAYNFVKTNVDFILGSHGEISIDAPANMSFLIGYNELGGGYPNYPHHAAAFGKSVNDWALYTQESNTTGSVPFEHELTGGLAGGPESACSDFYDKIDNFISNEYCSYYNAGFTGAVAYINNIENNALFINHYESNNDISIFPNPANNFVIIEGDILKSEVIIYNSFGKIVSQFFPVENVLKINLEIYSKGIYFLNIKNDKKNKTIKLIKT